MLLSPAALKAHFEEHSYFLRPKDPLEITLDESGEVFVTYNIESWQGRSITIDLMADFADLEDFIQKTGIRSLHELSAIRYSTCLAQYVLGKGYVSCMLHYMNSIDVNFRVLRGETQVSCLELHWYDEVDKALTLPEQFVAYIQSKWPQKGFAKIDIKEDG